MTPVSSMRSRTAPFATAQISPCSGSQTMTPSIASTYERQVRANCFAPSIMPSSSTSAATTTWPGKGPASCNARTACSIAATPDFMSALPRPQMRPSDSSAPNGSTVHDAPAPSVTTSV